MRTFKALESDYKILLGNKNNTIYPLFRNDKGSKEIFCISPNHGRSFLVGKTNDNRYVVSKGNGLSYSQYDILFTREFGNDSWGLLLKQDAIRDYNLGEEISSLGIKTNKMEYVIELGIKIKEFNDINPVLLQYNVECPYRICDVAFMPHSLLYDEVCKWNILNEKGYSERYLIAANVLIKNLRTLHDNGILHNAIHSQNYTWALELLDFELACSPAHPYNSEDDMRHIKNLFPREIIQTYEVINHIAWCLKEDVDFRKVDELFKDYGFDIDEYKLSYE